MKKTGGVRAKEVDICPFWPTERETKIKVEVANRPPTAMKGMARKDRDVGTADNAGACRRTVRTSQLCMMRFKKKGMSLHYDEKVDWTEWIGAVTYNNWSYGASRLRTPTGGLVLVWQLVLADRRCSHCTSSTASAAAWHWHIAQHCNKLRWQSRCFLPQA